MSDMADNVEPKNTIRITRQGKIRYWVNFALEFFEKNPEDALMLYTPPGSLVMPRLITVVEIIKREYMKILDISSSLSGLHQYNRLGYVEDAERGDDEERLQPYMKITLSRRALPGSADQSVTYQTPAMRRLSRTTKARMRKRQKGEAGQEMGSGNN
ncbi:hypothetical protein SERLA73DRAFT_181813 [Serpula lacrymans var. lacrymans S7.3]|uniref:DNA/RNA-binding protein Alba-like domain-containing protein n=2 Tax=Serpula lacrymans var. lacrymans TaxID=341189 RepID=F8PYS3_SERL3|nr:uncharacterized protein SERLADRAFT_468180 [Serpula lacrymans var. lacrymans S7.9]EGN99036.1 hypothetical protein SERLA73DRAFT_181813 [Serpula lacrymans var. lacrymans S7.3]EGO24611.1 hypothetical protein SERLADRAFT_468180 [Serpula lacrymans var. lacrymans S7.9]